MVRANVSSAGIQAMGGGVQSNESTISGNGRFVAFNSLATNLVAGDTNNTYDVFVHDRLTGMMERVSVSSGGAQANAASTSPSVSTDGRYVVYRSSASNLVAGDTNNTPDLFVRDRTLNTTARVSVTSTGGQPTADCTYAEISGGGRYVCFSSASTNLVPGDSNAVSDIFVRDIVSNITSRVSISTAGAQANGASFNSAISNDGRYVAFSSGATNLVAGDTNAQFDIFVRDRTGGTTARVSMTYLNGQANNLCDTPSISGNGRYVSYQSTATNLVPGDTNALRDVFRFDRNTSSVLRISLSTAGAQGDGNSDSASMSSDGRYVLFHSAATNFVAGDLNGQPDVFRRDALLSQTLLISADPTGNPANSYSSCGGYGNSISDDGRFAAFYGNATNLVVADTNADWDVFLRDTLPIPCPPITSYCIAKVNSQGCIPVIGASGLPSASGQSVLFITALEVLNNKSGLFFWGRTQTALPFLGGLLCTAPPITRTTGQSSGGNAGPLDCSGTYSFAFNSGYIGAHGLSLGDTVYGQFWSRDQGFAAPNNAGLTDAICFTICP
jgi:Tol biopolymer transport system component